MRVFVYSVLTALLAIGGVFYWQNVTAPARELEETKVVAEASAKSKEQDSLTRKVELLEAAQIKLSRPTKSAASVRQIEEVSDSLWTVDPMANESGHLAEVYRQARASVLKAKVGAESWVKETSDFLEPQLKQRALEDFANAEKKVAQALSIMRSSD